MHVALLAGQLEIGGAELAMIDLARGLAQRGHRVTLFTLVDTPNARRLLPAQAGVDYRPLNGPKARGVPAVLRQLLGAAWRLRRALAAERADVLYSALNIANLVAWLAAVATRVPLAWSFHAASTEPNWEDALAIRLCGLLSRRVRAVVAVSDAARTYLERGGIDARRLHVIANGTDTLRLRPDAPERARQRAAWQVGDDTFVLGVVARVVAVKAPERLIAALALACARAPDLRAIWVGGGAPDYLQTLREAAAAAGVGERLRFAGPSLDPGACYNGFDAFTLLSHAEGFGKAVAEAMAVGLPCVVDRHAGAETLGDAGIVVDGDDADAVAAAYLALAGDAALRARLGERARARAVQSLSLEAAVAATEALLMRLAGGTR